MDFFFRTFRKKAMEEHFESSEKVRDFVIGMSDGLTVPFALAAGLSGAVNSTDIVITAGLAEIAAGSIAMGLGGYLAGRTEIEQMVRLGLHHETHTVHIWSEVVLHMLPCGFLFVA